MINQQYGTWTTIDCPTKNIIKAQVFLEMSFAKIGGVVRKFYNPHDFVGYPSFEVDYPKHLEDIDADEYFGDKADQDLAIEKSVWHYKAEKIEEDYNRLFGKYL